MRKKKILITGSKGMLGRDLCLIFNQNFFDVVGIDIEEADITDFTMLKKVTSQIKPEYIIHTAAYTDVDGCEVYKDKAFEVNSLGTRNICLIAQRFEIPLVYISTDYVFDGIKEEPYIEFDNPNPINIYGLSKLAGERFVTSLLNKYFIVRSSWLFGKYGKNFVKTILNKAKEEKELKVVNDQRGNPSYTKDLSFGIMKLITTELYGIYHLTNQNSCTWFEFAQEIIKYTNYKIPIIPIKSDECKRIARRPSNSQLKNYCFKLTLKDELRCWKESLKEYMGCPF